MRTNWKSSIEGFYKPQRGDMLIGCDARRCEPIQKPQRGGMLIARVVAIRLSTADFMPLLRSLGLFGGFVVSINMVLLRSYNCPRKARCWRVANSASSSASDARCAVFSVSTAVTPRANSRGNSKGEAPEVRHVYSPVPFSVCPPIEARFPDLEPRMNTNRPEWNA